MAYLNEIIPLDGTTFAHGVIDHESTQCSLTLLAPSGFATEGGGYYPAESVKIDGLTAIAELMLLCERLIEAQQSAAIEPSADATPT